MKKYYLAIDIGASSGRHILGWLEDGQLKLEEIYRFKNGSKSVDGHLQWQSERLIGEVVAGLKKAKEIGKVPEYIGVDTWAVDYALLDKNDKIIGDIYSYRDSRTQAEIERVHNLLSFDQLYSKTGIQFQPFNTIYQLSADITSGKIQGAESFLMLPDYINFRLTGVKKQEYTNATSTGMVNAQTHQWDEEIIEKLGLPSKLFDQLSQPGSIVGTFSEEMQKELGYQATVILPATHDTASAVLAAPLDSAVPYISSGTWSLLGVESPKAYTDENSQNANYSNEGSIDYNFRYQKNIMGTWIIQSVRNEQPEEIGFGELADMARGVNTELFIDVNDNRFLSPVNMSEEIDAAIGKPLNLETRMAVIYNGLALSYKQAIEELEANVGKKFATINVIGGGCRDTYLNELTSKATGKKVIIGPIEATSIGNIIMQMIGVGDIEDIVQARQIIKKSFDVKEIVHE